MSSIRFPDNGTFSMATLTLLPNQSPSPIRAGPGQFDFILLDPPWPNRSARRSRSYATSSDVDTIEGLKCTLGQHIAPSGGIVACWISNSSTARATATDMFAVWNVAVVEEWYWLKVTTDGRAVTDVRGVWRKPYEVLLIGRRSGGAEDGASLDGWRGGDLKRRVIVAVPDVHSRKPSVKLLVEEAFGFEAGRYRGLEVFARNMTVGWWAWGDECLRFQWEGWWVGEGEKEQEEKEDGGGKKSQDNSGKFS